MRNILQEADSLIHGTRQDTYGHCLDEYTRISGMVNAAFADKLKAPLTPSDMMIFMVILKLSRLMNDPNHRDSLVDAAGYLGCIEEADLELSRRAKLK